MIELKEVEFCYPSGVVGLRRTTLKFHKADFAALIGPSGAGKSTLLRCINFLNRPTSGKIEVEGMGKLDRNRRRMRQFRCRTAMIFQRHQLLTRYSALKNVMVGCLGNYGSFRSLFPLPRHEQLFALECLDRTGLLDKALERVDRLSGGEQQRVGIARALAQRPQLILADEPVASLDPGTAENVLSQLYKISIEDHIPVIVSLHQVELAKKYASRIIGLSNGAVIFDGSPNHLSSEMLKRIYRHERIRAPLAA
ncbi:MAG: phosphonate ABC transporter ATP-binding protein [Deltaproteobacteria bacterium]|nr:phosphonate ABC transporter ATP-binding protein [Deltaproteobacteria bacterium]